MATRTKTQSLVVPKLEATPYLRKGKAREMGREVFAAKLRELHDLARKSVEERPFKGREQRPERLTFSPSAAHGVKERKTRAASRKRAYNNVVCVA